MNNNELEHHELTKKEGSHSVYDLLGKPESMYFVLQRLNQNQVALNLMQKVQYYRSYDVSAYSVENELPVQPYVNMGIYPANSINSHLTGALIATCPDTLKIVANTMTPAKKVYYMYDVAWLNFDYLKMVQDSIKRNIEEMSIVLFRTNEDMQYAWNKMKISYASSVVGDFNLSLIHSVIYRGHNG